MEDITIQLIAAFSCYFVGVFFGYRQCQKNHKTPRCHVCECYMRPVLSCECGKSVPNGAKWYCAGNGFPEHNMVYHQEKPFLVEHAGL